MKLLPWQLQHVPVGVVRQQGVQWGNSASRRIESVARRAVAVREVDTGSPAGHTTSCWVKRGKWGS